MKLMIMKLIIITSVHVQASTVLDEEVSGNVSKLTDTSVKDSSIYVMSLNVYGWKTMPQKSDVYAELIKSNNIDVLGIQEGVEDWQLKSKFPTDYSRANALGISLGECWTHVYQIFINTCAGVSFIESGRFDLTDGPHATRTGEFVVIEKFEQRYYVVNVHWDHESTKTRLANAKETASQLNKDRSLPKVLLGDFNSQCDGEEVRLVQSQAEMKLLKHAGIDCLLVKDISGSAKIIAADPSDHPSIVATLEANIYP